MSKDNLKLCLITDRSFCPPEEFFPRLEAALEAGVTMVQFREKQGLTDRETYHLGLKIKGICKSYRVPLLVNDRLDLAMAIDADGLHLGQADLPVSLAKKLWDPGKIYGVSVTDPSQVSQAEKDGAVYVGAGAIIPTATKSDARVIGTEGLTEILTRAKVPVMVIGGIHPGNLPALVSLGCHGAAVVSALWKALDVKKITHELLEAFV